MLHLEDIKAMGITTSDGSDLEDNDITYIDDLYCAMEMVEHRFLVDETPSANADSEVIESSYTSRLVSKINILFENSYNNPYGLDCVGPEKKGIYDIGQESQMIIKHPDIVIHKGNKPLDGIQEIVCEIKRYSPLSPESMINDLNKLLRYTSRNIWGNPYKDGAFIVINSTKDQLKNKVDGYRKDFFPIESLVTNEEQHITSFSEFVTTYQERLKNALCFCHSGEGKVDYCSIYDIIQSKITH